MLTSSKSDRIGLFGGSFNPPTLAHFALAQFMIDAGNLDRLQWVVTPHNPLKDRTTLAPFADRMAMVERLIAQQQNMQASDVEQTLGSSATLNTVRHFRDKQPHDDLFFFMGADNWQTLHLWGNDYPELFNHVSIIVLQRPGCGDLEMAPVTQEFAHMRYSSIEKLPGRGGWLVLDNPVMDVSATQVRTDIQAGKKPAQISEDTWQYIAARGLYGCT